MYLPMRKSYFESYGHLQLTQLLNESATALQHSEELLTQYRVASRASNFNSLRLSFSGEEKKEKTYNASPAKQHFLFSSSSSSRGNENDNENKRAAKESIFCVSSAEESRLSTVEHEESHALKLLQQCVQMIQNREKELKKRDDELQQREVALTEAKASMKLFFMVQADVLSSELENFQHVLSDEQQRSFHRLQLLYAQLCWRRRYRIMKDCFQHWRQHLCYRHPVQKQILPPSPSGSSFLSANDNFSQHTMRGKSELVSENEKSETELYEEKNWKKRKEGALFNECEQTKDFHRGSSSPSSGTFFTVSSVEQNTMQESRGPPPADPMHGCPSTANDSPNASCNPYNRQYNRTKAQLLPSEKFTDTDDSLPFLCHEYGQRRNTCHTTFRNSLERDFSKIQPSMEREEERCTQIILLTPLNKRSRSDLMNMMRAAEEKTDLPEASYNNDERRKGSGRGVKLDEKRESDGPLKEFDFSSSSSCSSPLERVGHFSCGKEGVSSSHDLYHHARHSVAKEDPISRSRGVGMDSCLPFHPSCRLSAEEERDRGSGLPPVCHHDYSDTPKGRTLFSSTAASSDVTADSYEMWRMLSSLAPGVEFTVRVIEEKEETKRENEMGTKRVRQPSLHIPWCDTVQERARGESPAANRKRCGRIIVRLSSEEKEHPKKMNPISPSPPSCVCTRGDIFYVAERRKVSRRFHRMRLIYRQKVEKVRQALYTLEMYALAEYNERKRQSKQWRGLLSRFTSHMHVVHHQFLFFIGQKEMLLVTNVATVASQAVEDCRQKFRLAAMMKEQEQKEKVRMARRGIGCQTVNSKETANREASKVLMLMSKMFFFQWMSRALQKRCGGATITAMERKALCTAVQDKASDSFSSPPLLLPTSVPSLSATQPPQLEEEERAGTHNDPEAEIQLPLLAPPDSTSAWIVQLQLLEEEERTKRLGVYLGYYSWCVGWMQRQVFHLYHDFLPVVLTEKHTLTLVCRDWEVHCQMQALRFQKDKHSYQKRVSVLLRDNRTRQEGVANLSVRRLYFQQWWHQCILTHHTRRQKRQWLLEKAAEREKQKLYADQLVQYREFLHDFHTEARFLELSRNVVKYTRLEQQLRSTQEKMKGREKAFVKIGSLHYFLRWRMWAGDKGRQRMMFHEKVQELLWQHQGQFELYLRKKVDWVVFPSLHLFAIQRREDVATIEGLKIENASAVEKQQAQHRFYEEKCKESTDALGNALSAVQSTQETLLRTQMSLSFYATEFPSILLRRVSNFLHVLQAESDYHTKLLCTVFTASTSALLRRRERVQCKAATPFRLSRSHCTAAFLSVGRQGNIVSRGGCQVPPFPLGKYCEHSLISSPHRRNECKEKMLSRLEQALAIRCCSCFSSSPLHAAEEEGEEGTDLWSTYLHWTSTVGSLSPVYEWELLQEDARRAFPNDFFPPLPFTPPRPPSSTLAMTAKTGIENEGGRQAMDHSVLLVGSGLQVPSLSCTSTISPSPLPLTRRERVSSVTDHVKTAYGELGVCEQVDEKENLSLHPSSSCSSAATFFSVPFFLCQRWTDFAAAVCVRAVQLDSRKVALWRWTVAKHLHHLVDQRWRREQGVQYVSPLGGRWLTTDNSRAEEENKTKDEPTSSAISISTSSTNESTEAVLPPTVRSMGTQTPDVTNTSNPSGRSTGPRRNRKRCEVEKAAWERRSPCAVSCDKHEPNTFLATHRALESIGTSEEERRYLPAVSNTERREVGRKPLKRTSKELVLGEVRYSDTYMASRHKTLRCPKASSMASSANEAEESGESDEYEMETEENASETDLMKEETLERRYASLCLALSSASQALVSQRDGLFSLARLLLMEKEQSDRLRIGLGAQLFQSEAMVDYLMRESVYSRSLYLCASSTACAGLQAQGLRWKELYHQNVVRSSRVELHDRGDLRHHIDALEKALEKSENLYFRKVKEVVVLQQVSSHWQEKVICCMRWVEEVLWQMEEMNKRKVNWLFHCIARCTFACLPLSLGTASSSFSPLPPPLPPSPSLLAGSLPKQQPHDPSTFTPALQSPLTQKSRAEGADSSSSRLCHSVTYLIARRGRGTRSSFAISRGAARREVGKKKKDEPMHQNVNPVLTDSPASSIPAATIAKTSCPSSFSSSVSLPPSQKRTTDVVQGGMAISMSFEERNSNALCAAADTEGKECYRNVVDEENRAKRESEEDERQERRKLEVATGLLNFSSSLSHQQEKCTRRLGEAEKFSDQLSKLQDQSSSLLRVVEASNKIFSSF